jgi:RNA polymerase sigma factor (TIGR02999 family)
LAIHSGGQVSSSTSRISDILINLDLGNPRQAEELLALVYEDLRRLAARQLEREYEARSMQPSDLVHEAWIRLAGSAGLKVESRTHFQRIAARAMRQVLVDAARHRNALKRGGTMPDLTLQSDLTGTASTSLSLISVHEALERLEVLDPRLGQLVELRFFAGLTIAEAAEALGISPRTAAKDWAAARLWLHRELTA